MMALSACDNVSIKISMLPFVVSKFWESEVTKRRVREIVEETIEWFGVDRCMFASNYPVDVMGGLGVQAMYSLFWEFWPRQVTRCCPEALWRQRGQVLRRIFGLVNKGYFTNYSRVCYLFAFFFLNIHLKIKTTLNYLSLLGAKRPPEGHP